MNWLLYIGGGWLFVLLALKILGWTVTLDPPTLWNIFTVLCMIAVWVWVCWKFVSYGGYRDEYK